MNGFDILLEKKCRNSELKAKIATAFCIEKGDVNVANDYQKHVLDNNALVGCVVDSVKGDFALHLAFYVEDAIHYDAILATKRLSSLINSTCLFPSEDPNPFMWILLSPSGSEKIVFLDNDCMNQDIYRLEK